MNMIFQELMEQLDQRCDCMLVTVIHDQGSAPRGAGAQMLVGTQGRLAGTIGGGRVEYASVEMARDFLKKKESHLQAFRLCQNPGQDIGMICGGDVTVWFQYIPGGSSVWRDLTARVLNCFQAKRPAWFVQDLCGGEPSLVCTESSLSREDLLGDQDGKRYFTMPLPLGERAVVFGGGHIARALVPLLSSVGFRPVVFDCRPEYARPEDFPMAEKVVCGDYHSIHNYLTITPEDYVVVMTNGHAYDFEVQKQLLDRELAYIGVIGSRKKTAAVNQRLREAGISEHAIEQVHAPIGTKIKAVTPAEIAVSIVGEMICERALRRESSGAEHHSCPMG